MDPDVNKGEEDGMTRGHSLIKEQEARGKIEQRYYLDGWARKRAHMSANGLRLE